VSIGPSLYRRHRPRTFDDVIGQEHVVRTLRNAIEQDKVHHAYLFVGSRGTGKTSMAKILAACLNCEHGPTTSPCGQCDSCVSIASATSLDVIEMDAASNNSVDDIRDLREKVGYVPVSGRHKVYILDEAHMLSPQAWNAFLKTLEEPPPRTIFVLATTEAQKVLPTVVDRCHRFDFARPSVEQVAVVLGRVVESEGIDIEPGAVALVSRHATGSFRDALGTLEQLVTYSGGRKVETGDVLAVLGVTDSEQLFEALDAVAGRDPAQTLRVAAKLADSGRDPGQVLRDLEVHGRELLAVQVLGEVPLELRVTPERDQRLAAQAQALSRSDAVRLLELISQALDATANGSQARIQLELVLVKAASPELDPTTAALMARIERLEGRAEEPSPAPSRERELVATEAPAAERPVATPPGPTAVEAHSASTAPSAAASTEPSAPASTEPSAPAETNGAVALEAAVSSWPAVIDLVRDTNQLLAAALQEARPVTADAGYLTLSFPLRATFSKRLAEKDDYRRAAADALKAVTGYKLALRYELSDVKETDEPPEAQTMSGEELVRRFLEEFDAEEIFEDEPQEGEANG
jgi:DNA polymerase III subunit gamma/tau